VLILWDIIQFEYVIYATTGFIRDYSCRAGQSGTFGFALKDRSGFRHAKQLKSANTERRPTRNPRIRWPDGRSGGPPLGPWARKHLAVGDGCWDTKPSTTAPLWPTLLPRHVQGAPPKIRDGQEISKAEFIVFEQQATEETENKNSVPSVFFVCSQ
jgi:hypothetical protein